MASTVRYPDSLPDASALPLAPTERRSLSDLAGPQNVRSRQRDFHATQDISWTFIATEAEDFMAWWDQRLRRGGLWFSASWPLPSGGEVNVYRFLTAPRWQLIPDGLDGIFSVTATVEVRGRGVLPTNRDTRYLTSKPYPLMADESAALQVSLQDASVAFAPHPREDASSTFSLMGVSLSAQTYRVPTYAAESASVAFSFTGVSLTAQTYSTSTATQEAATAAFALTGVSLRRELIKYTNWPVENTTAAFSLKGVSVS